MEKKILSAAPRTERKSSAAKRIRRAGRIPAVVYGKGSVDTISIDAHEFQTQFQTVQENSLIQLKMDANTREVLVKDFQRDILTGKILHVDFYEVSRDKLLKTKIPVRFSGTPKGVREGGILEIQLHELEVECFPQDLPERIAVDISNLDSGRAIHVRELAEIANVRFLTSPDQVVANITHAKAEAAPAEAPESAEAAAAPEAGTTETK